MVFLSKLFTFIFLPPGIFILALFFASFSSKYFKKTLFTLALFLYFISTQYGSNLLLMPLENFGHKDNIKPKAVVVLGGGSNIKNYFRANGETFKREINGFLIAKEKSLPLIFSGGGLSKINEADSAKDDFDKLNRLTNSSVTIYYEKDSLNTKQNAAFTSLLFEEKKLPKEIYLVTSAYHIKRAYEYFKMYGFKVVTVSVEFLSSNSDKYLTFLPKESYFHASYLALHEYFGLLKIYLLKS